MRHSRLWAIVSGGARAALCKRQGAAVRPCEPVATLDRVARAENATLWAKRKKPSRQPHVLEGLRGFCNGGFQKRPGENFGELQSRPKVDPSAKMGITFTCTACETRITRFFHKMSYERGVVIIKVEEEHGCTVRGCRFSALCCPLFRALCGNIMCYTSTQIAAPVQAPFACLPRSCKATSSDIPCLVYCVCSSAERERGLHAPHCRQS